MIFAAARRAATTAVRAAPQAMRAPTAAFAARQAQPKFGALAARRSFSTSGFFEEQ